jgi:hypothetical protein
LWFKDEEGMKQRSHIIKVERLLSRIACYKYWYQKDSKEAIQFLTEKSQQLQKILKKYNCWNL